MGSVYFIRSGDTNIYKIGHTQNTAADRMKGLQTGNPYLLTISIEVMVENSLTLERDLHKRFNSRLYRKGSEWYQFSDTEIQALKNSFNRKAIEEQERQQTMARKKAEALQERMKEEYYRRALDEVNQEKNSQLEYIDVKERELAIREQAIQQRYKLEQEKQSKSQSTTSCLVTAIIIMMFILAIMAIIGMYITWY